MSKRKWKEGEKSARPEKIPRPSSLDALASERPDVSAFIRQLEDENRQLVDEKTRRDITDGNAPFEAERFPLAPDPSYAIRSLEGAEGFPERAPARLLNRDCAGQ